MIIHLYVASQVMMSDHQILQVACHWPNLVMCRGGRSANVLASWATIHAMSDDDSKAYAQSPSPWMTILSEKLFPKQYPLRP